MICYWCREPLSWVNGKGWVHSDGSVYQTRTDLDGDERDNHRALPVPDDALLPHSVYERIQRRRQCLP